MLKRVEVFAKYESFIFIGVIMVVLVSGKLAGFYDISSDFFWLLAGFGLIIEGTISFFKQRKFDNKYMVVERKQ